MCICTYVPAISQYSHSKIKNMVIATENDKITKKRLDGVVGVKPCHREFMTLF